MHINKFFRNAVLTLAFISSAEAAVISTSSRSSTSGIPPKVTPPKSSSVPNGPATSQAPVSIQSTSVSASTLPTTLSSAVVSSLTRTSAIATASATTYPDGPDYLRLRLIAQSPPTADKPAFSDRRIQLNGAEWYLTELFMTPENAAFFPEFTAISYRWYDGRLPNPFFDGYLISNLTMPSLESAMRNSNKTLFWIDGFSIPAEKPLKGMVLDLLSNIFSAAYEVVVPLGLTNRDTLPLLAGSNDLKTVPAADLERALYDMENDAWVQSIWTYKESLNSKRYYFTDRALSNQTGSGSTRTNTPSTLMEPIVRDAQLFNRLGEALSVHAINKNWTVFDTRANLPHVDGLVDQGADWMLHAPYTRSVFGTLANLDTRYVESDKNFFWGLYGSITDEVIFQSPNDTTENLYERFFEICEKKGDYSFIYTSADRDTAPGKTWYPKAGPIHSILSWSNAGDFQNVTIDGNRTSLQAMVTMEEKVELGTKGISFIEQWFATGVPDIPDDGSILGMVNKCYELLKMMGFTGSQSPLLTNTGMFFPQSDISGTATLLVATQVSWTFGGPGLVKVTDAKGATTYVPGAFIGSIPTEKAAPVLML